MELVSGFPLLLLQFNALFVKNAILAWRNRRSMILQLLSPLFFFLLLFAIQKAIEAEMNGDFNKIVPEAINLPPIPPCEEKYFIKRPCYDFVWSGNESQRIGSIVSRIMENNPGRPIPSHKVKSFKTSNEVDEWLFNYPMRCPGAMHFVERNANVISYGIQTNSTQVSMRGRFEDETIKFQLPLQIAAERETFRSLVKDASFSWVVGVKGFQHPRTDILSDKDEKSNKAGSDEDEKSKKPKPSAVDVFGPVFFLTAAMFAFVFQMSSLIREKELKLRQAMTMMGLYDTSYWLSWLTWEGLIALLSSLLMVLLGMAFQFNLFLYNSFVVLFLVFFLFQLSMLALAFMLSAFISKASASTALGFLIFIIGFITQDVTKNGMPFAFSRTKRIIWFCFPPNLLSHAIKILSDAISTPEATGISWSRRSECAPNVPDCGMTIDGVYKRLAATFLMWFLLAIYFDNIIPNPSGVRKPIFYFLKLGYWTNKDGNNAEDSSICSCIGSLPSPEQITPDDEDVLEEEKLVKKQAREGVNDPNVAVQIQGLVKTYPGKMKINFCCCRRKGTPAYHAVKGLWVNFEKDQLFCLLGPNGAGKTTTISCLTGITPLTSGDALIYGNSVRSSIGMSNIRRTIGVCPQFDILWDALTGQEHLHLFASIKGLPPASIKLDAQKSLAQVRLTEAANMRSSSYSGGMKRRLSVAIALIGDPKLVILDEPTTGMDPISRRHVWDIIEEAKKGRAIVLTTHSMEEADILSDRIGIMAKGRLRCVGTSIRLKSRFGSGFIANISFSGGDSSTSTEMDAVSMKNHEDVKQFFKYKLDAAPRDETKTFLAFIIPHDKEGDMAKFFSELEDRRNEFGIADIQLSLTTLEEVFLNIARQAEFENATDEGNLATLHLTSGAEVLVPVGTRFIGIPGTESVDNPRGTMVEVYWDQDDSGDLCISGHSEEMPIPPNIQLKASSAVKSEKKYFGQKGPLHGVVIDPNQVSATNVESSD